MKTSNNILSLDDIRKSAPSVFALEAKADRSEKYRFFPTIDVVNGLLKNDFQPVYAKQSKCRDESNRDFTRHVLRFRHASFNQNALVKGQEIPEIVLLNSHNGSSSYQIDLGMFRVVCSNGLIVSSASYDSIRVRHSGHASIIDDVIEGSFKIIEDAPKVMAQIEQFKERILDREEQRIFAETALELRGTTLDIQPSKLLQPRRSEDGFAVDGQHRNLWKTMNVVQENLIRGGVAGITAKNKVRRLNGVNSVDGDTKLNRALWQLTEKMAELKMAA